MDLLHSFLILLVCANLVIAFPMWYGHPLVMGTYQRDGDWWGKGIFSGWGQQPLPMGGSSDDDLYTTGHW